MADVLIPRSRVEGHLPIEIDGSVAYEIVLTMWSVLKHEEKTVSFDLGPEWRQTVRSTIPEDLATELETLGGPGYEVWLGLLGLMAAAPHPHDPDHVLAWLGQINPSRLRRWLIGYLSMFSDPSLAEQAAEGDLEAVRSLLSNHKPEMVDHVVELFRLEPTELRHRMVSALTRFRTEVFAPYEPEFAAALARAAAAQLALLPQEEPGRVIEQVTNGVEYDIPRGVNRIVLIPSVVVKPLSMVDQHRDSLLVFYGIADEFVDADAEAPPSWLVRSCKALGDERRLRILRRLAEAESTLDGLGELLGLTKSTVHHHVSILRGAGLVRVHISRGEGRETHTYGLRPQALEIAWTQLDGYLRPPSAGGQE